MANIGLRCDGGIAMSPIQRSTLAYAIFSASASPTAPRDVTTERRGQRRERG